MTGRRAAWIGFWFSVGLLAVYGKIAMMVRAALER